MNKKKLLAIFIACPPSPSPLHFSAVLDSSCLWSLLVSCVLFLVYLSRRCLYVPKGLSCIDCNFCCADQLLHRIRKSMKVSSAWQEEKEMKNDCIKERGKGQSAGHYPEKQCFVNKYVVCQEWQTLEYPHCGKSPF